ncbi:MAG TPA: formylglycine-generating enzyme family protein [Kiritimatiellia bacterium]|nr:formylglycine-generating enzyme family protein [Kiritimatiellia bacterium]HMP00784.1 formylglycine-generating enzyme family protein [Kiritimatiellia bacterium]HMP96405.1 formylglycine-generating enzyme family protein [Kiritimatiellia bacterium]
MKARISLLMFALSPGLAVAEVETTAIANPRQITWEAQGITASVYHVESTPDVADPAGWKGAGQVVATGPVMSATFNITNDTAFYRVRAVTSAFPKTRHEMVLIPDATFIMGGERTNWATSIFGGPVTFAAFARELPQHPVPVSSFLMDKFEVTNEKLAEVFQWAYTHELIDVLPIVITTRVSGVTNITTNINARVMNMEGASWVLFRTDVWWSEIRFTNHQFVVNPGRSNFPAIGTTWYGAQAYANYRSDMEGLPRAIDFAPSNWAMNLNSPGYRLPTEAEWEKAARGGVTNTLFPWPNDSLQGTNNYLFNIDNFKANYWDFRFGARTNQPRHPWWNQPVATTPVGYFNGQQVISTAHTSLPPESGADAWTLRDMVNPYGLYDMAGNVYEWCWDWAGVSWYTNAAATLPNPTGETNRVLMDPPPIAGDPGRVLRGGGWIQLSGSLSDPSFLRCAYREGQVPYLVDPVVGFRLVRSIR